MQHKGGKGRGYLKLLLTYRQSTRKEKEILLKNLKPVIYKPIIYKTVLGKVRPMVTINVSYHEGMWAIL